MNLTFHLLKEIKNKRGEIRSKVSRVTNKNAKEGITFATINEIYNELLSKYKASQISIIGKALSGNFTTLKNFNYQGDDLKYSNDEYFSNVPKQIKERLLNNYYSIDIIIKL